MLSKRPSKAQKNHWSDVYEGTPAFFGEGPSDFARRAMDLFREEGVLSLLELGFGQGRDTFFFAQSGLQVTALDYSERALEEVTSEARERRLDARMTAQLHDVRQPLPFPDDSFDACFSHMLLCMELTTAEIAFVLREVHRVLKPGGLAVYSVRSTHDKHYRTGTHLGEDVYEVGGFVVHFFSEEKIRRLASGYDVLDIGRMEEGSLPRDLFVVSLRKTADVIPMRLEEEEATMADPMGKFQEFFDTTYSTGVLDRKTKHLLALAASLAAGCDP